MAKHTTIATRAIIVYLKSPLGGAKSPAEISAMTGVSKSSINRIYSRAIERGFDPNNPAIILEDEWLQDEAGRGRKTKQTEENKQLVIMKLEKDPKGREKTCAALAGELSEMGIAISASTIRHIRRKAGLRTARLPKQ
ncbi:hypothetical protein F4861DRAFT_364718 [Xylaria intraflava]|nr:hypothetical protein F4861DRAFT_364718 [Xylaria intraflava]